MTVGGTPSTDRVWPSVGSLATLPNVNASPTQSALLQVGDLCPVAPGVLYICTDKTLNAAVWQPVTGGVLWRWNGVNTAQFLPKVDLGIGAGIAGLTLSTVAGGPNGTLLRLGSTELVAGGVAFPINAVFPRRYIIEAVIRATAFTDVTNAGRNRFGVLIAADSTLARSLAMTSGNNTAAQPDQILAPVGLSAGTPFAALVQNASVAAEYMAAWGAPQSGFAVRYTVNTQRPFVSATPEISVDIEGSGIAAACATRAFGNAATAGAYPAGWNGITLNTLGLTVGNDGVTTAWTADIESLIVRAHPNDYPG